MGEPMLVVQLRGLPFSATPTEIVAFLGVDPNLVSQVEITKANTGRPSGECFCVVADEATLTTCVAKHKEIFGDTGRYAEVYKATAEYFKKRMAITQQFDNSWDGIVRLRGLPFTCTEEQVTAFFGDLTIPENGIFIAKNKRGQTTGEGFVQFTTFTQANKALEKSKESIGERYIEVYKASNNEMRRAMLAQRKLDYHAQWCGNTQETKQQWGGLNISTNNSLMNNRSAMKPRQENKLEVKQDNDGVIAATRVKQEKACPYSHIISLTELPNTVTAQQLQEFFHPHRPIAVNIKANGCADVAFKTSDAATAAMEKQGSMITVLPAGSTAPQLTLKSNF